MIRIKPNVQCFLMIVLCVWSLLAYSAASPNPCEDKHSLAQPILALKSTSEEGMGIGGTGFKPTTGEEGDGIGGTGIIGVISGFGSICVGGHEIHYEASTPVWRNGQTSSIEAFGLGQTVSVRVALTEKGYIAQEVLILHEVQGIVESVEQGGKTFKVAGQTIEWQTETPIPAELKGKNVAISGHRLPNGHIQATRMEPHLNAKTGLIGVMESVNHTTRSIGGQVIEFPANQPQPALGSEIQVEGTLKQGILKVERWRINPRLAYSVPVQRVFIQARVRSFSQGKANLEGIPVQFSNGLKPFSPGDRVEAWIHLDKQPHFEVERAWKEPPPRGAVIKPEFPSMEPPPRSPKDSSMPPGGEHAMRPDLPPREMRREGMPPPRGARPPLPPRALFPDLPRPPSH